MEFKLSLKHCNITPSNKTKMSIIPDSKNPFQCCCPFRKGSVSNKERAEYLNSLFDKKETPEALFYAAHIPGLKEDQVNVEVEGDTLLKISLEKVVKQEEHDGGIWRSKTKFTKTYELPENAETDQIKASVENGILTVAVSKKNEAKIIEIEN